VAAGQQHPQSLARKLTADLVADALVAAGHHRQAFVHCRHFCSWELKAERINTKEKPNEANRINENPIDQIALTPGRFPGVLPLLPFLRVPSCHWVHGHPPRRRSIQAPRSASGWSSACHGLMKNP